MRTVDLTTIKNKLGVCVQLVARGETVLVTDGNRIMAEIVPPRVTPPPRAFA